MSTTKPELLAPAGQPDAGYAALHYGADAVYLGLNRFSARAEAVNFTPDELAAFAAYAHSLTPSRNVYLTLNTLVQQTELADAAETLLVAAECGVDAVIVQDLGVARLARERFPRLQLHASTQMAIHNLDGAKAAAELGYRRVTVARELTLAELSVIAAESGLEVEAFIHGTLCYSYSGLCLFSSMVSGRSGNRGRCTYTCREAIRGTAAPVHPFSLKDLALGERVRDLARAGVSSLKIEGRKKSPLYVGATVAYYRRLLDGDMSEEEKRETEMRLRTIFARPWTRLFLDGRHNPEAADPEVVGHRGARVGEIGKTLKTPAGPGILFRPDMPVERHDGLQVDIPGQAKPFGFPVDSLYLANGARLRSVFAAPAGAEVAVTLPADAPVLKSGYPIYVSSSQAVKRAYPFLRPKPGEFANLLDMDISIRVSPVTGSDGMCRVVCRAEAAIPGYLGDSEMHDARSLASETADETAAFPARDAEGAETAARGAFSRTGGKRFRLAGWDFDNPHHLYVKPGDWNRLRRAVVNGLQERYEELVADAKARFADAFAAPREEAVPAAERSSVRWSVFVERLSYLDNFTDADLAECAEVAVDSDCLRESAAEERLLALAGRVGRDAIRLAIPVVVRADEAAGVETRVRRLLSQGWRRWLVAGLAGWRLLREGKDIDMAADWPLYTLNSLAWRQLSSMGFSAFTFSPEDGLDNMRRLDTESGHKGSLVVYSDPPLFISAACAHAHMGLCRGANQGTAAAKCLDIGEGLAITLERSGGAVIWPQRCGSVVVAEKPYSLSGMMDDIVNAGIRNFRVDFRWKQYHAGETIALWRRVRSGGQGGTTGNFRKGVQ